MNIKSFLYDNNLYVYLELKVALGKWVNTHYPVDGLIVQNQQLDPQVIRSQPSRLLCLENFGEVVLVSLFTFQIIRMEKIGMIARVIYWDSGSSFFDKQEHNRKFENQLIRKGTSIRFKILANVS